MPRVLDNWLRAYSEYTDISEAPIAFNFWTGVTTIAGALRRQVWIDQIKFKWLPCFYTILVSPPGVVTKSSTINVGIDLLRQVDGVIVGPSSMTWQGLTKNFEDSMQLVPMTDGKNLLEKEFLPMSAISIGIRELGTFLNMRDPELISVLIELWDGNDLFERWLRSSENTRIENPFLNIISATTPSWIVENFGDLTIGGGLASRIIFVYADKKRQLVPLISAQVDAKQNAELEKMLVHDLREIAKLKGAFKLTPKAEEVVSDWYGHHWLSPDEHLNNTRFEGYKARKQTHMMKLCMVLSASEDDNMLINEHHVNMAMHILAGVEADMLKVFTSIGKPITTRHMEDLLANLRVRKKMTKPELWRIAMTSMSAKEFSDAMDGLIQANYIAIRNEAGVISIIYTRTDDEESDRQREETQRNAYAIQGVR